MKTRAAAPPDRVWFVIPMFNEGARVADVVRPIVERGFNVVAVDDGSFDDSSAFASQVGAHVLRHLINRGQGAALQTGMDYALAQGAERIVTFDSDGQHGLDDAESMLTVLNTTDSEVVLGSRFRGKAIRMPLMRRIVLKLAIVFTNATTGLPLTDTHNGLRALTRGGAEKVKLRQDRMAHASEFLAIIAAKKMRFTEIPVTITYTDYSMAKGQRLSNAVRIIEDLVFSGLSR